MALKGKLRDFSLTQLLNLVHLARKTGALSLDSPRGNAELFFHEGMLVYATLSDQPNSLAELLLHAGKLTQSQVDSLSATGRSWEDKQLGILLINAGQVTRNDILQAVRKHMSDVTLSLFGWEDGSFVFDQKLTPPTGRITIPMGLENMIMEGGRRREEVAELQSELPSLDVVLKFTDGPGKNLRNINLSVDEWRVISFINPRNTVATIAQFNQMSENQIRRIVAKLLRDELVEVVTATPSRAAPPATAAATVPAKATAAPDNRARPGFSEPQVDKGIISRLISRIRGL